LKYGRLTVYRRLLTEH